MLSYTGLIIMKDDPKEPLPRTIAAYEYLLTHSYKQTASAFDISISTLQRIRKQVEQNNIA